MKPIALLLALAILLVPGIAAARSTLVYKLPEGFLDVSPGAPKGNFASLTQSFVAEATSGKFEAFAIDRKSRESFEPRFFALAIPNDAPITAVTLDDYAEETIRSLTAAGNPATLIKKELLTVSGVRGGRVLLDKVEGKVTRRVLIYLVPDGDVTVTLFYMSDAATFEKHREAFEHAAEATAGAVPATNATLRKSVLGAVRSAGQVSTVTAAASPFTFAIPDGMIDVTTPGLDPDLAAEVTRQNYAKYAIGDNGETFNAVVDAGALVLREEDLDEMVRTFEASFVGAGKSAKVIDRSIVTLAAGRAARIIYDTESNGIALRGLWYTIPAGAHYARLTYLSAATVFPRLLPDFEAAARATTVTIPPDPKIATTKGFQSTVAIVLGAIVAAVVLIGAVLAIWARPRASKG